MIFVVLFVLLIVVPIERHANEPSSSRGRLCLALHCHHQRTPALNGQQLESHVTVSLILKGKVTKIVSVNRNF